MDLIDASDALNDAIGMVRLLDDLVIKGPAEDLLISEAGSHGLHRILVAIYSSLDNAAGAIEEQLKLRREAKFPECIPSQC